MEKVEVNLNISRHFQQKQGWTACAYCNSTEFSKLQDFIKHLRQKHCTQEGGSFVCRYGDNRVCCTLPVEGVSDADYEQHVYKHHAFSGPSIKSRKSSVASMSSNHSRSRSDDCEKWTIYSASQNLPAVLNDPSKGKQKDFFTKMWGDGFVEVTNVPGPSYLPNITLQHFQGYLRKIAKRHRKHARLNAAVPKPHSHADLLQNFPNLRIGKSIDKINFDMSSIPKIFLEQNFHLSSLETFSAVYPHTAISTSPSSANASHSSSSSSAYPQNNNNNTSSNNYNNSSDIVYTNSPNSSAKLLQEKLTHYLDMVEVQIAQQVAQKSEAFFHAMTSHDTLMEQLGQTIAIVKTLREKIHSIDRDLVKDPLLILRCERTRRNHCVVLDKLRLMSSVLQTQPTIQLLLSTPDYVAALDLIYTTQDLLAQELGGVHSFRHLSSELNEMVKVIDTLMAGEFERYATADLNRPLLESEATVLEGDKLSCIVLGMLRQSSFDFVDAYQRETVAAIKAAVKQAVIEVVASSEFINHRAAGDSISLEEQLKALSVEEWTMLLKNATTALLKLVCRVKNARDVMQRAADVSAGKHHSMITSTDSEIVVQSQLSVMSETGECFLSAEDYSRVTHKLNCLLASTCQYAQERCAQLLSSRSLVWPEENGKEEDSTKMSAHWLAERATLTQLSELSKHVDMLSIECEKICPDAPPSLLRSAFKSQANRFMHRFHLERMTKLSLILESEAWRQTEVPVEFQRLVNHISESGRFSVSKDEVDEMKKQGNAKPANVLYVGTEKFAVVGTVLILVDIVAEYCVRAEDITLTSHSLLRHLGELLQVFNSRTAKLVLGAEAVSDKTGLKKITSINLALVLRALQLILWLIPHVRIHFEGLLPESSRMTALDQVTQQMRSHVRDVQNKLCAILEPLISNELRQWEAKPPVPSRAFQNICRQLRKLYEAVASVLPEEQVEELYRNINTTFKEILREHLLRMNIVNNGGPQHGLVTSELIFYLEDLKRIKVLPENELNLNSMDDIWTPRQAVIR